MAKVRGEGSHHLWLSVVYPLLAFIVLSVRKVMVSSQRSAGLNGGHNPSVWGGNPGHRCSANLCLVCERVILHKLLLKIRWCLCAWQGYPTLSLFLFAGTFPMQTTCKLPAYQIACHKSNWIFFLFEVLPSNEDLFPYKKMCGKLQCLTNE